MHYLLLVTFNKDEAENSQEARQHAFDLLSQDTSFVGEGGRFSSPIADWFVIGGRWSGHLSDNTWAKKAIKKINELEKKEDLQIIGCFYGDDEKTKRQGKLREKVEKIYKEYIPFEYENSNLRYDRSFDKGQYNELGLDDDAMVVTEKLYDLFLKQYKGKDKGETLNEHEGYHWSDLHFIDLNYDPVAEDNYVGKKWICVVDYHS